MACSAMHCLIAQRYCEKNNKDMDIYFNGAILPDLAEDKDISHFAGDKQPRSVKDMIDNKVDIAKSLQNLDLNKDLDSAIFLHLVTDLLYYNALYFEGAEQEKPSYLLLQQSKDKKLMNKKLIPMLQTEIPEYAKQLFATNTDIEEYVYWKEEETMPFVEIISSMNLKEVSESLRTDTKGFVEETLANIRNLENVLLKY